jgi:hypothetical protein
MRLGVALGLVLVLSGAACGGAHRAATSTLGATTNARQTTSAEPSGLRVGVVGRLALDAPRTVVDRGSLEQVAGAPLVLVSRGSASLEAVARAARSHPASHFALVGQSTKLTAVPNLVGLVLSDVQAARLAGVVAGYAAADAGGVAPRVAWVGPVDHPLANAFADGVHRSLPGAVVLDEWSRSIPGRCKEAALAAIARGAMVVMANRGLCALAAVAGAREQNVPGLLLANFEFPSVAANLIARDAVAGSYHGGEDILFGARSGAIGVGAVDPRISFAALVRARAAAQVLAGGGR